MLFARIGPTTRPKWSTAAVGGEVEEIGVEEMGERRLVLLGLGTAMVVGILVYLRLWFMDYTISSDETDLLRKQFDLANRDAMDESAEWRMRYDREVERASKCAEELSKVDENRSINTKLEFLHKENLDLLERLESLKRENAALKSKCRS